MSPQRPQSVPPGLPASQTNTASQQDISISHHITIAAPSLSLCTLKKQFSEEKARGSCKHFSPTSTSHIPACTGPALAHSGGPVAVQQRHVTLGGRSGLCHPASLSNPYSCAHLLQTTPALCPQPYNLLESWFALCRGARVASAWAGVAGAMFLTFHFMRSASVTFGSSARLGYLSLPPSPGWL